MALIRKWCAAGVCGIIPASIALALSALLIRNMDAILLTLGPLLGLGEGDVQQYSAIFAQLRDAALIQPEAAVTAVCCLLCLLTAWLVWGRKRLHGQGRGRLLRRCMVAALLWLPVLAVITAGCVWLTDVNSIRFGTAISSLVRMILAGAF